MTLSRVRDAYSEKADDYIKAFGSMDHVEPGDRNLVLRMAQLADGPILDAGCGPGQWTEFLNGHGHAVEGVDVSPVLIDRARQRFPGVPFRVGTLQDLETADGALAGVLCWYSIIHTAPGDVGAVLREFARCIKPSGYLVMGFFDGECVEPFEHKVSTAYRWPVYEMFGELEDAGFVIIEVHARTDPGHRPHGAIFARSALSDGTRIE